MKMNWNFLKKSLAMVLATICISLPFANTSEAAETHTHHHTKFTRQMTDVYFIKDTTDDLPNHHRVCKKSSHDHWSKHFHCTSSRHNHKHNYYLNYDHTYNESDYYRPDSYENRR